MKTYRRPWQWFAPSQREARDEAIREQWAMGKTRRELAEQFDLTPQRIDQIVRWMKEVTDTDRNRQRPTS